MRWPVAFAPLLVVFVAPSAVSDADLLDAFSFSGRIHCEVGHVYNKTRHCQVHGDGHRDLFDLASESDWTSLRITVSWRPGNVSQELNARAWPWTVGEPVVTDAGASPLDLRVEREVGMVKTWKLWITPPLNTSAVQIDQEFVGRAEFFGSEAEPDGRLDEAGLLRRVVVGSGEEWSADGWQWGLAGGALFVAAWRLRAVAGLQALLGLFARLSKGAVAQHPRRRQILDRLAKGPPRSFEALRRELGLANGAFEHHVGILLRHGLVRRVERWGHPYLVLPSAPGPSHVRDRILELVRSAPGMDLPALAQAVGHPTRRVRYHVRALEREEYLQVVGARGRLRCYLQTS